jgi:hypothetical protein
MSQNDDTPGPQFVEASPTILKRLIRFSKQAGAVDEESFDRNGFLSYHAETHAAGMGIAAGWWYGAEGETQLLSWVYGAAVYGRAHASNGKRRRILKDIAQEPHYALGGVVVGAVLGSLTSHAVDVTGIDPAQVWEVFPLVLTWVSMLV